MNSATVWIFVRRGELVIRSTTAGYRDVLVCAVCLRAVKAVNGAALCWQVSPHDKTPHGLGVVCNDTCESRLGGNVSSLELVRFARPGSARRSLAALRADFVWTAAQLEQLTAIAGAASALGITPGASRRPPCDAYPRSDSVGGRKAGGPRACGAGKKRGKLIVDESDGQ